MERFVQTDAQWAKMEQPCLGKPTDPGRSGSDNRRFVEAVLWIVRTGSPWRDLPTFFGNWNSVFKRYRDWVKIAFVLAGLAGAVKVLVAQNASLTDGRWSMSGEVVLMTLVRRSRHRVWASDRRFCHYRYAAVWPGWAGGSPPFRA
jgi:transposase